MILARILQDNADGNLMPRQVEYARNIHAAGSDLLSLVDDILQMAKAESRDGAALVTIASERMVELRDYIERTFRQVSIDKGLDFEIAIDPRLPAVFHTDPERLRQILSNLLSNAFKFTRTGGVSLHVAPAASGGWSAGNAQLDASDHVVAFSVTDTGIGIPQDKQGIIFEQFQQADSATAAEYGGTGLGLAISRELAGLLGGEIAVRSSPGTGSTFTLYLPLVQRA